MIGKLVLVTVLIGLFGAHLGNAEPEPQYHPMQNQMLPGPAPIIGPSGPIIGPSGPIPGPGPMPIRGRVCYACSSTSDPSCWYPGRQTTVKYCARGYDKCVTKIFKSGAVNILVRDCANSCNDPIAEMPLLPKTRKCHMCYSDLCNGAFSITSSAITLLLLTVPLVKSIM